MKIYEVGCDFDHYWPCYIDLVASSKDHLLHQWDIMIHLDGTPQREKWWPRTISLEKKRKKKLGNVLATYGAGYIVIDHNSADVLAPVMGEVELLPLRCDFGEYWCVNALTVLDCIDYEKSDYVLLSENEWPPRILRFNKYVFRPDIISGHHFFKIVNERNSSLFADDTFVEDVTKHGITGFEFIPVWEG